MEGSGQDTKGPGKRDEGGHETGDMKTDHWKQEEEEENGCGHEQCGLGKTGDGKQHQTGGQSRSEKDEKRGGEWEENGIHKDWGAGHPEEEQEQQQEQKTAAGKH